jgi:hypothetical protein
MLEYFVHLDQDDPPSDLVLAVAELAEDLAREEIDPGDLPGNWRHAAAPPELLRFGNEFAQRGQHCVLRVPSVLSPSEYNCLVNNAHPEYRRIAFPAVEPLSYDPRMFRKGCRARTPKKVPFGEQLRKPTTGQVVTKLEGIPSSSISPCFRPDEQCVVTASEDHTIKRFRTLDARPALRSS